MPQEFINQLEQFRHKFIQSLPERAQRMEEIWSHLRHLNWSPQGVSALQQLVHKLAGSSGSFGFPELGQLAKEMDVYLNEHIASGRRFGAVEYDQIDTRIEQLCQIMLKPPVNDNSPLATHDSVNAISDANVSATIFVVDNDHALAALLCAYLRKAGFDVVYFETPQDCIQELYLNTPQAILMDMDFEHNGLGALSLVQQMKSLINMQVPILLMSARTDVNAKLRALRAGSNDYFTKPLQFQFVIDKLHSLINQHKKTYKVMIVDDDIVVSQLQASILETAGMNVLCVNQPLLSLQQAAQFQPDLVILDMHMPKMNGMELAVLLRQDPNFLLLPIIFLTADTDAKLHKEITDLGVNALISKPINPKELLHHCEQVLLNTDALKNRISRITQRNQQPQQITRSYFFSAIDNELHNKPQGKDLSALYYISVTNLETLSQEVNTTDLINIHETFCNLLSQNINSDEQWVDLSNLVACVLAGKHNPNFHQERCEQLTQQLTDKLYASNNSQKTLTIHIGVAYLSNSLGSAAEAITQAERVFSAGLNTGNAEQQPLTNQQESHITSEKEADTNPSKIGSISTPTLENIVFDRDLALAFQPIINLEASQIEHFSVLARLRRENGELIPASQFLDHLTQLEKRIELDRWVLQRAVAAMAQNSQAKESATLFIHLAIETLNHHSFFALAANVLRSSRLRGSERLVFILEESWILKNFSHAQQIADQLKNIACSLCVTHAGDHPDSLLLLQELDFQYLRLAPSLSAQAADPTRLGELITCASQKKVQIIATQIEDSQNLSKLWMQGIRLFEGFFIQPPDSDFHLQNQLVFAKELAPKRSY